MSQQGPGGYGGGWGPPGGVGGAPGAPQGWGPQGPPAQPPYGAPPGYGPPGGGPQPPKKKTNPLVWIGVGCAVLFLFGVIGSGAVAFILARNAKRGVAGAFSAAVELAIDGGAVTFDAGASTGTVGGPTCERAADCCRRVLAKTGSSAEVIAACDQLRTATELACSQALEVHSKSAPLLGTSCP
ncbi:MAG TPA: hypothetical protein VMS65_06185 [Polyangiaceae bacterium]|nr:hypothetical protein [Polyangiaceae bacterium]